MQVADIGARSVPELCVKTLREPASMRAADALVLAAPGMLQQKMRKQPHAQYKSLKNFAPAWREPGAEDV
ncbi:hypothetical protein BJA01nite_23160 [Bradyrhizobium japonicum]|nr:major facilitator superfamily transporter [Bradyrhizobium japonicum USDA 6]GEC44674.1 hypothetical protein BJA01nite_23160 [Bradyrhizobium japonicum]